MEIRDQQVGGRHKYGNLKERSLTPWNTVQLQYNEQDPLGIDSNLLNIIAERDAAIREKNQALLEKKKAFEERRVAIAQRNLAIRECNDAVLERNNAFITLQQAMISESIDFGVQDPTKRLICSPGNQAQYSSSYFTSDVEILDAFCKTMVASDSECPAVRSPKKRKRIGEDMNKSKKTFNSKNPGLNKIDFDETEMPIPGCSCTGILRRCYKWGSGGWQSSCCTNTISAFPLPLKPHKRHIRIGGRKMSGGAFSKLLSRLAVEGFDFSRPVDLKEHWSKHGTNRYITIK
ncbi:hypothetical protein KSS87_003677 [Heliosperma pusillum]|nr:hypothetical protein KSS87_003677 [Heliosperma pusillum]